MLIVLGLSFAVAGQSALANLRSQAAVIADEIADILIEPLYTVDVHEEIGKALTLMHDSIKYGAGQANGRRRQARRGPRQPDQERRAGDGLQGGLTIRTEETDTRVVVSVIDSGSGIPAELREKIWKPFFTTRDNGEGIGLGLDISRRLVERYGGRLYFESEPGHTEFHVDLPRGAAAG